jgi:3-oxoacyl-[acyl-carrier protein] reductase
MQSNVQHKITKGEEPIMSPTFRGQTVLVTGGASGIGRAIVEAFGQQGANIAYTYFSSENAVAEINTTIENAGGQALALHADLTSESEVERVVAAAVERFQTIDILITNSGGLLQRSKVRETPLELWNQALAVNLTSTFLCCRAVLPLMEQAGRGCIITMSSLAAHDGGGMGASHYAASKGGVLTFTKALAKEVGPLGIRVNGIAPGLIATRFHDQFSTAEGRKATVERTPLRREGLPEDVANVALFLASPAAAFMAGETVEVNGGQGVF